MKNYIEMDQIHGNRIILVSKKDNGKVVKKCDGMITNDPEATLSVHVADCLPIFFYSPSTNSIGVVHAGWRGLYKGIIGKTVELMYKKFEAVPKDITTYIGPHICQKHYEIKNDVSVRFTRYSRAIKKSDGKIYLDLGRIAKDQLIESGISKIKIKIDEQCTFENMTLDSYRRGDLTKRTKYLFKLPSSS